jgi:hypothetical protein
VSIPDSDTIDPELSEAGLDDLQAVKARLDFGEIERAVRVGGCSVMMISSLKRDGNSAQWGTPTFLGFAPQFGSAFDLLQKNRRTIPRVRATFDGCDL